MASPATKKRKIIVNIATSADGYIARPDGDIEWLTRRPHPKGFYGMGKFMQSIDTKLLGRKTYDHPQHQCRLALNSSRAALTLSRSACEIRRARTSG